MRAFIKDFRTFTTTSHNLVLDYTVARSIYDKLSTIVIETPKILPQEGDILYLDSGFFGVIKTISVEHGKTELACNQISAIFNREMFYTAAEWTYLEERLAQLINDNYVNCTDPFYAIPYLQVNALTQTAAQIKPDVDNNNVYTVQSYAAKMRRLYNIFLDWSISRTALVLDISEKTKPVKNIDFSNPKYYLTAQDFSSSSISKVTTYAKDTEAYEDWILLESGEVTNTPQDTGRVSGEWTTLVVQNAEDAESAARDVFVSNEYSHNIEFQAPLSDGFELYDRLKISLDNRLFSSYVAGVSTRKNSDKAVITCGELQMEYPYLESI